MLKKVTLTNIATGRSHDTVVDTDTDAKALVGAGKAPNETARVSAIGGADEFVQRMSAKKPSLDERVAVFGGLARCLDRNISTIKSLELQTGRVQSPRYRGILAELAHQISIGEKLSDAMAAFPDAFSDDILALIRAGEESGRLSAVCSQIANSQRKTVRILKKLKTGMIYPALVLVLAVGVTIAMSFTLVPAIAKLYGSMHATLPFATVAMMKFSDLLIHQPYLAIVPFIGLGLLFKNWSKIYARPPVQKLAIALPTVGVIIRKSAATVSFRALAMLLQANVRISTALEITAASSSHIYYREFFTRVRGHVIDGLDLPESFLMESHWLGPDGRMISAVMQIASETGSANEMLDEIATDYEDELDTIANQIDKILEPLTMVVMGVMVGFLVYAIYGPIFGLSKVILPQKPPVATAPAAP
ncbi:MAG TPA: type II secretion system F family protein [Chthoniobacterales bacterium]|nr:type II secretion system F family protein [Chthoniobacterales bacterium]